MIQYALILFFYWGMAYPDRTPELSYIQNLPGAWSDDVAPSFDEFVVTIMQAWPTLKDYTFRASFMLYCLISLFWFTNLIASLLFFVPISGFIIIGWWLGPVFVTSWAISLTLASMILISAASSFLPPLWVETVGVLLRIALGNSKLAEATNKAVSKIVATVNLAANDLSLKPVTHRGKVYSPSNLTSVMKADPAMAGAVASMYLYCPVPREGLSSLLMTTLLIVWYLNKKLWASTYSAVRAYFWSFKVALIIIWIGLSSSHRTIGAVGDFVTLIWTLFTYPFIALFWRGGYKRLRHTVRLLTILAVLRLMNIAFAWRILAAKNDSDVLGFSTKRYTWRSLWNNTIQDLTRFVDKISVPNVIRSLPDRFDAEAINETNRILESLGFPKAPEVGPEPNTEPQNFKKYADAFIGRADIRQGILHLELSVAKELDNLKGLAPQYKRTEQYATFENELESLSRYFEAREVDLPDLPIDEIWVLVGKIFEKSRLTPFSYILKKWEKKYGLGPFYGTTTAKGKFKKLSRRAFINQIGGMANMLKLWAKTFEVAPGLVPVAPVSVKNEALPEKKWANDIVRTVIGSPIVHYISSTMWNFDANHRNLWWSTNIKVGMPLNGFNFSKLVREHLAYDVHFAGDFSAFDSTVEQKLSKLIAKVRKAGFNHGGVRHRDYSILCFLIDSNYNNLVHMPLMTTSTGNIYKKRTGLSTGHSSTSMDNSLAVTLLYLAAWKKVTGLTAHQFRHYCKLSNYGDDHILSWLASAPASWNSHNIMLAMKSFGVDLRDEEPSHDIMRFQFLSKGWRKPTTADVVEMERAGLRVPDIIAYHDAKKLAGKAYAPSKDIKVDRDFRVKRLVSYLYLTAHHKDLYDKIREDIELVRVSNKGKIMPYPVKIPTYDEVLQKWYNPSASVLEEDQDPEGQILDYSMDGFVDSVVNIMAVVPDILNPSIYNMGYTNYLTSLFRRHVNWPLELIRRANTALTHTHLVSLTRKTCYDFLSDNPAIASEPCNVGDGGLLLRHWLFIALRGPRLNPAATAIGSWIDRKLADLNFVINGHVQPVVRRLDFPFFQILLVAALALLPDVPMPWFVPYIRLPSIGALIESMYGIVLNLIWSKVPANMKEASSALAMLGPETHKVLIQAPTGTGKSTTLVNFIYRFHAHRFVRYIIVVPRHLLVLTLTPYLRSNFGVPAHEVTTGFKYDPSMRVVVTTAAEVLLHEEWLTEGNLIQLDESHVVEPLYLLLRRVMDNLRVNYVMTTATPSESNLEGSIMVPLTIASTWKVLDTSFKVVPAQDFDYAAYWESYRIEVLSIVRSQVLSKILVFVVDVSQAQWLAARCGRPSCILSSTSKVIDPNASIIIATSVADVGLTIPDVDWVITSNILRKMVAGNPPTVSLVETDPSLLRQRRGRTGRTSNGLFTLVKYDRPAFTVQDGEWTDVAIASTALKSGVPVDLIAKFMPQSLTALWGKTYDRSDDEMIDKFVSNFNKFKTALDSDQQRTFAFSEDGVDYGSMWTIQGNSIPTIQRGVDERGKPAQTLVTADVMLDFIVGASKWLTERDIDTEAMALRGYFRTRFVSAKTFIEAVRENKLGKAWHKSGVSASSVFNETQRFGRSSVPSAEDSATPVLEGFNTFANPSSGYVKRRANSPEPAKDEDEPKPKQKQATLGFFKKR
jgi:hypothetical protein